MGSQLQRAREIVAKIYADENRNNVPATKTPDEWAGHVVRWCQFALEGAYDDGREVKIALAAIQSVEAPTKPADLTDNMWTYRGWSISFDMPPIPSRAFDWSATGPNYDASYEGPEDGWVATGGQVHAATYEELLEEIDAEMAA